MREQPEKKLEMALYRLLVEASEERTRLARIPIAKASSAGVESLADLVRDIKFKVFERCNPWWKMDSAWQRTCRDSSPIWLQDISGGQTPDLVLRSDPDRWSGENRILIEVKGPGRGFHYKDLSQIDRYLLHLAATTRRCAPAEGVNGCTGKSVRPCPHDARRAVLLAAPRSWFSKPEAGPWRDCVANYKKLAEALDITLGEIHVDLLDGDLGIAAEHAPTNLEGA